MQVAAALVLPAIALVFAVIFAGLWYSDRARLHLLGFGVGFFSLFLAMTLAFAVPAFAAPITILPLHALACLSVIAIVWGAVNRLNQRTPLAAMGSISLLSSLLLIFTLQDAHYMATLLVQNGASGLLFAVGAVALWAARATNVLDRALVWTMSLLSGFSLLRPILLIYLETDLGPVIERETEFAASAVIILTVLTAILGIILIAMAVQEALKNRHGAQRSDPISGFQDQRTFKQSSESALATAQRLDMPVALAVLKLDWFEAMQEKWGADTSDMLVREISDVIRSWQRDSDVIGRIAEDQFGIMFVGVGANSAQKIIGKLREDMDRVCNEKMSGLLRFTLTSSILEAKPADGFEGLLRETMSVLVRGRNLGANLSFVNGVEVQQTGFATPRGGTFVTHG
ncbi:MAG: diguanylate cyclase [Pseudomonadota bacterium]